jgi:integrase
MTKRKKWSFSAGSRPHSVVVYERTVGGPLYARAWDPSLRDGKGGQRRESLGHRDRARAKRYAKKQAAKLAAGEADIQAGRLTLARLFALYDQYEICRQASQYASANRRAAEMFVRVFGADKDPMKLSRQEWLTFIDERRSGAIDARGQRVSLEERRPVGDRTVATDLDHLASVVRWATLSKDQNGRYYLSTNPVRSRKEFPIPREKNPARPLASSDRYEALLRVAHEIRPELPTLMTLAHETGRRISSILGLRYEDLDLRSRRHAPNGSITWSADIDKIRTEWRGVPITPSARAALDQHLQRRPGIGGGLLFPAAKDPDRALSRNTATKWLHDAEKLAGLERIKRGAWHTFRRGWATEMKHGADKDVMALGGWRDLRALKSAYQHADPEGMLLALKDRRELREAR